MTREKLFDQLWMDYIQFNLAAEKIVFLFKQRGEIIVNDHIAFRTFNDSRINIEKFKSHFIPLGYEEVGDYDFKVKKLSAIHLEHKFDMHAPKIFISQLRLEEFSDYLQDTVQEILNQVSPEQLYNYGFVFSGRLWNTPSYKTYQKLREESEYAAWLYAFGFRANHFTINVNQLNSFTDLFEVNEYLKENGFHLNTYGGEIKGSKEKLLEQSSTLASKVKVGFSEGLYEIPGCYYEFARRHVNKLGEQFNGFIADSANKIFESTDISIQR
ncbi:MAG: DUF1338 domain-containing protein [Bacteroidia bacterium]|nr:DUF1338 domain-containing protein [Bacteroidia bacterium]